MAARSRSSSAAVEARPETTSRMRERILDGAMRAIVRHGLMKLGMSDVCLSAGVSRGTLYRYFQSREELLDALAQYETERFRQVVAEAVKKTPPGDERIEMALKHVTRYVGEHPAIRRIMETEPAFVLTYLREHFPVLREMTKTILGPLLRQTTPVRARVVNAEQLADWLNRFMISAVLFPDPDPDEMARRLTAVYRLLTVAQAPDGAGRRTRAT
jgi:AcrR family transcriptional regulator